MSKFINKAKGWFKQAMGGATGNQQLKREGKVDSFKGQAEGVVTDVKRAVKGTTTATKDVVKD